MRILVACEESQAVTKELRALGHEAYSCDIQECSGGYPEWHILGDALHEAYSGKYEMMLAFPPCTHLSSAGAGYWPQKQKDGRQKGAIDFFFKLYNAPIQKIAIENPTGIMSTVWRKPDQIINPFQFGDPYRKRTCLWLKNLNLLVPTNEVEPIASWHSGSTRGGKKKDGTRTKSKLPALHSGAKMRSKTFPGIAKAMAEQWAGPLTSQQHLGIIPTANKELGNETN